MQMKFKKLDNLCDAINKDLSKLYREDISSEDFEIIGRLLSMINEMKGRLEEMKNEI